MQLHSSADWWGLWWLALFATLLFAAARIPVRRSRRAPGTAAPAAAEPTR